jgi:tripartite-type tricarboxylate transporter receptor subunit TctC
MPILTEPSRRSVVLRGAAALGAALAMPERGIAAYPDRNITIIVAFPAGGGTDAIARMLATPLSEALGKPVVIENRPGAGGNIGIGFAARAQADGYTLLLSSSVIVINPSLYRSVPFNAQRDFAALVNVGVSPAIYTVRNDSPIKTLDDLIAIAKAKPGKLNYTDAGIGTAAYLSGRVLRLRTGIDIQLIPYAGSAPAAQALVAGTIDLFITSVPSVAGLLASGQIRMIAQTGARRMPDFPAVPTFAELGIKNAEFETFQGFFLPSGTPRPVVDKLAGALGTVIRQADMTKRLRDTGLEVLAEGPADFAARVAREQPYYHDVITRAGIQLN